MSYTLYYKLIPLAGGIVCHGLQKTANRFLVEGRNASELLNYLSFHAAHAFSQSSLACKHINNVHAQPGNSRQIGCIRVSSASFVAALGVAINSSYLGQILLFKAEPDPFFA